MPCVRFRNPPTVEDVVRRMRHRHAAEQIDALYDVVEFSLTEPQVQHEIGHLVHDPTDEVREEMIRTIVLLDDVTLTGVVGGADDLLR